ncbi:hypothetical protein MASR1M12_34650 [Erysipelotrichia bacterium]
MAAWLRHRLFHSKRLTSRSRSIAGIGANAADKASWLADRIVAQIATVVQAVSAVDQTDRIDIENGGCLRPIADFRADVAVMARILGAAEGIGTEQVRRMPRILRSRQQ